MMNFKKNSPHVQNGIAGMCLFFTVGIYLAVLNLGAGGAQADAAHVNNIVAACLYATFAVSGVFGGSTLNTIGPRYTMMIGAFGYGFYITGLWYFDYKGSSAYAIIGGVVLGYTAGLLWSAANYIAFCYAAEHQKGQFVGIQGLLTTFGNLIAACVVMGISFNDPTLSGVPLAVYATFFSLMMLSLVVAWFLVKPEEVRTSDGKPLAIFKNESWFHELKGIIGLFKELRIWLLFPALLTVENPLVLQGTISAYWFNLRTRALVIFIGPCFQLLAYWLFQYVLDSEKFSRKTRAFMGFACEFGLIVAAYSGEAGWVFTRPAGTFTKPNGIDWSEDGFAGFFIIFLLFQIQNAIGPMYLSWLLMTFTNEPKRVGRQAGMIKGIMATGTACFFGIAASGVSLTNQVIIHFATQCSFMLPLLIVCAKYVTNTNYDAEKDVVFIPSHEADVLHLHLDQENIIEGEESGNVDEKIPTKE